ncbi:MAG: DUF2442 domain-containing protein [Deltaproteobacteria bacterium]|nr:DUF2442 domain-containing protein [Deltaproteobacteria bacterium]
MIVKLTFGKDAVEVSLDSGEAVQVPIARYPTLERATRKQRENYEISPSGYGVHWPDLDEDLSFSGFIKRPRALKGGRHLCGNENVSGKRALAIVTPGAARREAASTAQDYHGTGKTASPGP